MASANLQRVGQSVLLPDLSNPQAAELKDLEAKRKMAELLYSQGNEVPQGQMVSGRFVAPSWSQNLNMLASRLAGAYLQKDIMGKEKALAEQLRQAEASDLSKFIEAGRSTPAQTVYGAGEEGPTMTTIPAAKPDYSQQLAIALKSQSPLVRSLGTEMLKQSMTPTKLGEGESLVTRDIFGTGEYAPIAKGGEKLPTEYKEYQKAVEGGFKGSFFDYQQALKRAGASNVSVNTEQTYGGALAKGAADEDKLLRNAAVSAPEIVSKVARNKKILDSGNFFSGKGANIQQEMAMYADAVGLGGKDTATKAANTQSLIQGSAETTLNSIKSSGLGSGQGFTDKDREFLQDAKSFRITMNKENIKRVLDLEEKAAIESAKKWNQRVKQLPKSAVTPLGYGEVEVPTAYGQSNVRNEADRILQGR